jgi:hypothetical protein
MKMFLTLRITRPLRHAGALGKWSRVPEPLIFVTELVAFFNVEGWSRLADDKKALKRGEFFGFSRTAFGMVKTRTNGSAYSFTRTAATCR